MTTTIIDRVVAHGDDGTVLITRDRAGTYFIESRTRKGDRLAVRFHPDAIAAEDGLLDQLDRFVERTREPAPEGFSDLLWRFTGKGCAWTVKGLASAIGVSDATVYYWRQGTYRPYERHIRRLAQVLGMTTGAIRAAIAADWQEITT